MKGCQNCNSFDCRISVNNHMKLEGHGFNRQWEYVHVVDENGMVTDKVKRDITMTCLSCGLVTNLSKVEINCGELSIE